jgi:2-dehydro-3-deoxyphosphogluconate aldolase/(4S)-4-hydroxy-2-oxoglutarate aldolase
VRDLLAPLPALRLVPTGGVSAENARDYLQAGAVAVALGGSLVSADLIAQGQFSEITRRARQCIAAVSRDQAVTIPESEVEQ